MILQGSPHLRRVLLNSIWRVLPSYHSAGVEDAWVIRNDCTKCVQRRLQSFMGTQKTTDWSKAVSDAEKIVGYPTSFLSLRCLLSDELSNVALNMRKLVGTKHPLLKTARGLVHDGKNSLQTRGLVMLLLAKAAGSGMFSRLSGSHASSSPNAGSNSLSEQERIGPILTSQRNLAEITEMIHTANLIHKGVVNLADIVPTDGPLADMEFGNKMAVLSGDFLLASASRALAELNNSYVVELISSAICDLMEAEFTCLRDASGGPRLQDGITLADWQHQVYLAGGSLLAKSCAAVLRLANHSSEVQEAAAEFGTNMAYAHQMKEDMQPFINPNDYLHQFVLTSAPMIKYTELDPTIVADTDLQADTHRVVKLVAGSSVLSECRELCGEYSHMAVSALGCFPTSDAKLALINMVQAITGE